MDNEAINRNLLEAVRKADLRAIEHIFQLPNLQSAPNWSTLLSPQSLELACEEGHVDIVEFLLERGNPENYSKDPRRTTLLHRAVKRKGQRNLETAQFLCDFAASCGGEKALKSYVNIQDEDGKTALHHAAEKSDFWIVKFLIHVGVDVTITENMKGLDLSGSTTAWDLACNNQHGLNHGLNHVLDDGVSWMSNRRRFRQSFPSNLEAACALVANEFESRGHNSEFSWDTYTFKRIAFLSFRLNHFRGIYALIGKLLSERSIRIQDVNRFIRGFQHEQYIMDQEHIGPVVLKLREPSCIVAHDEVSKYFTIVMPYFKILERGYVKTQRTTEGIYGTVIRAGEEYKSCPSHSLESLQAPYLPLTLDEYCCPALPKSMLDRRNRDQVLLKAARDVSGSAELVTVCQLWSLPFSDGLIIAHDQSETKRDPRFEPKPLPWAQDYKTGDIKRYIGIMLTYFIEKLDPPSPSSTDSGNPILNSFENFIAICAHQVDEYSRGENLHILSIDMERGFLHNIDDIRGELGMIKRVILQQEEVWKTFASNAWPEHWTSGRMVVQNTDKRSVEEEDEWHIILRAQSQFDRFRRRIAQLDEDAARIEKSIMAKLDLKQKYASLRQAHATVFMGAAVLGFTVITIIFTPLSFLTSLFALSIDRFQRNQVDFFIPNRENEANFASPIRVYTANYIGKWAATTGLVSTTVCLLAAWFVMQCLGHDPVLQKFGTWVIGSVRWLMNCLRDGCLLARWLVMQKFGTWVMGSVRWLTNCLRWLMNLYRVRTVSGGNDWTA